MDRTILKRWSLVLVLLILTLVLLFTGGVSFLTESFQLIVKKTCLVVLWYFLTYLMRLFRIGHISWEDETDKRNYYFVLLIGSALIIAFS